MNQNWKTPKNRVKPRTLNAWKWNWWIQVNTKIVKVNLKASKNIQNCTLPKTAIITMYTSPKSLCPFDDKMFLEHLPAKKTLIFHYFCTQDWHAAFFCGSNLLSHANKKSWKFDQSKIVTRHSSTKLVAVWGVPTLDRVKGGL